MENNNNQNTPFAIENLLQTQMQYHSQNVLKNITYDCADRCLDFESSILNSKEEQCVKRCTLTYYETFYSSHLN